MPQLDQPLVVALAVLAGLALFAARLVLAVWHGRVLARASLLAVVTFGLLVSQTFGRWTPTSQPMLVAGAATSQPPCGSAELATLTVSGHRVRLAGEAAADSICRVWAVVTDPRTGLRWVQGPAMEGPTGWTLDLVVGIDGWTGAPLEYDVWAVTIPQEAHDRWLPIALVGAPVAFDRAIPPEWLVGGSTVTIEQPRS